MKQRLFITFCALVASVALLVAADPFAEASFGAPQHDFGTIKEAAGQVYCDFEFRNIGNKPLIIHSAHASCGCTKIDFPTKPIKPGKKSKVRVFYSPVGRPGAFRKTIKLRTNGRTPIITLIIEGVVVPKNK